jgi:hypothetical protein
MNSPLLIQPENAAHSAHVKRAQCIAAELPMMKWTAPQERQGRCNIGTILPTMDVLAIVLDDARNKSVCRNAPRNGKGTTFVDDALEVVIMISPFLPLLIGGGRWAISGVH